MSDGAELTFRFHKTPNKDSSDTVVADGHLGPCAVYMKKVDSAIDSEGTKDDSLKT